MAKKKTSPEKRNEECLKFETHNGIPDADKYFFVRQHHEDRHVELYAHADPTFLLNLVRFISLNYPEVMAAFALTQISDALTQSVMIMPIKMEKDGTVSLAKKEKRKFDA